ncbi:MAG: hypothetical protein WCX29_03700, partial [Candidatus Peribacteraceae bacterium]
IRVYNDRSSEKCMDVHAFLDADTTFLSASGNGEETTTGEIRWEDICISSDSSTTLTADVRVRSSAHDGQRLLVRARADGEETTEYTTVNDDTCYGDKCYPETGVGIVTIDKEADRREVQPGSTLSYTLTLRNLSEGIARNINVEDTFTAGSLTVEDAAGGYTIGNGVRWDIPTMGPGETRTIRYRVRVSSSMRHGQIITNTVQVRGSGFDRVATDSTQTSVIEYLPQTGTESIAESAGTANGFLRRAVTGNNAGSTGEDLPLPLVIWTTLITMGMTAGSVLGKHLLL